MLAAQTQSAKGNGIIIELKTRWMVFRKTWQVETRNFQVGYFATLKAAYMVVSRGVGVEACLGLRAAYFDHQPGSDEGLQNPIDGCSGQSLNTFFEIIKELVSRRVVRAFNQGVE